MAIYCACEDPVSDMQSGVSRWSGINLGLLLAIAVDLAIWLGIFMIVQG